MLETIKGEFLRICDALGSGFFVSMAQDELQVFTMDYDFKKILVNMRPQEKINSEINTLSGVMVWKGDLKLDFISISKVNDTEDQKDLVLDSIINFVTLFSRKLYLNEEKVFDMINLNQSFEINRFKTAQYCVALESVLTFQTGCNRIDQTSVLAKKK